MNQRSRSRFVAIAAVVSNLGLTAGLTWFATSFQSVDGVLAQSTWGAGTPSSTYVTAFATLRPWWIRWEPEAVRPTPAGGIEPVVRIPRSRIVPAGEQVLPTRGIGYYAILGFATAARSLSSPDLIFDFRFLVLVQRGLLVLALTLAPLALYFSHPSFSRFGVLFGYNLAYGPVLLLWPNRSKFVTEGLVDSALGNALAVLGVFAFLVLLRSLDSRRGRTAAVVPAALFLSFCSLVRGEFLLVYGFVMLFVSAVSGARRSRWKGLALAWVLLPVFPLANGLVNKAVFDHFVPLRMQSGQNLFEPIGQFPNPYGIRYSDEWLAGYLENRGLEYCSFETDRYLTARYVEILKDNPRLFFTNFRKRLRSFSGEFGVLLNVWTIPLILVLAGILSGRDERFLSASIPLVMAVGYLVIFGWLNSLFRLVTPVHFLVNLFVCYAAVCAWAAFRASRSRRPAPSTPARSEDQDDLAGGPA